MNTKEKLTSIGMTPEHTTEYAYKLLGLMSQALEVAKEKLDWTQAGPAKLFRCKSRQEQRNNWEYDHIPNDAKTSSTTVQERTRTRRK